MLAQIDTYRHVWVGRNLPQGLPDSLQLVSAVLQQLLPDMDPADLAPGGIVDGDASSVPLLSPAAATAAAVTEYSS